MEQLHALAHGLLGLGRDDPSLGQTAARAVLIYLAALAMVRLGEKRFLGKSTAFDVILGVVLGSVVSRAINGSADLLSTVAAGTALVALHWLFAVIAFRSDRFGTLMKGHTRLLVKDGAIDWGEMRHTHMSRDDLLGALRAEGVESPEGVAEARLERSGKVSVLKAGPAPRILEARVENGTLLLRVRLE